MPGFRFDCPVALGDSYAEDLSGWNPANLTAAQVVHTFSGDSIRRVWSSWNRLCSFFVHDDALDANPMLRVERPRVHKQDAVKKLDPAANTALLAAITGEAGSRPNAGCGWERDHAIVLAVLLAGLRVGELGSACR